MEVLSVCVVPVITVSVYVDLKYNQISLTFTARSVCLCVIMWLSLVCL